jgi:hypothetical protein
MASMIELLEEKYGEEMAYGLDIMREVVWQADEFVPTERQAEYIFDGSNLKVVAGGVRAGKSKSTSRSMDWFASIDGSLIWIIGPDYHQCHAEFDYMLTPYQKLGLAFNVSRPQEGPRSFNIQGGARVVTKSSDDLRKLASFAPDAIMAVEAGQQQYGLMEKVLERGLEHNAYTVLSGTFEGSMSWYPDLYRTLQAPDNGMRGKSFSLPSWSNTVVFPDGKEDEKFQRLKAGLSEELYMERVEAVPFRPSGVVFPEFDPQKHLMMLEVDPNVPVELAIDPAYHTYAVLFIQRHGEFVHVLDEVYMHNAISQEIIPVVQEHPYYKFVNKAIMDNAARQKHGNLSVLQVWRQLTGLPVYTNYVTIQQGIDAMKVRLREGPDGLPRLLFSNNLRYRKSGGKAGGILAEFDLYHWPTRTYRKSRRREPVDENNDALKALSYYLYHAYGPTVERKGPKAPKKRNYFFTNLEYA